MSNKMLIDAAHPEETRVVVVRGRKLEEFDFESSNRKQLRGNIYLAKVTRVEASLQAAFVDYGGNRHGFLAFSEIHPDYYQIPVADREALLKEEAADEFAAKSEERDDGSDDDEDVRDDEDDNDAEARADDDRDEDDDEDDDTDLEARDGDRDESDSDDNGDDDNGDDDVESVGSEDAMEELPRRAQRRRNYKIQEVIKRRQVILVQVVKEERGKKGAALTTYMSLAGRHCVLMPNTARGGGISRKITSPGDRRRLREIAGDLNVPDGMGLIIRTAGANRTKAEIKRDFDYLLRLWETVRDLTLSSSAPALVYEEGSLIKRSIRDLYNKDIDEVLVEGEEAYKEAKGFMRMLMPSHAKNVKPYKGERPVFIDHGIEDQLDAMFSPVVTLRSGGYIVINQTEALVSVDVNSGKSTREHNIEDTALSTNLEACDEVSRQLRLRDLAGLIVIDFIDMEQRRNNRSVERRLKERLKDDRARIQVGRISHFGLLEMSRQRLRTGVLEGSTVTCGHCDGRGFVRSVESAALQVLRSVEEYLSTAKTDHLVVRAPAEVCLYILNQKRGRIVDLEERFAVTLYIEQNPSLANGQIELAAASAAEGEAGDGAQASIRLDLVYSNNEDSGDGDGKRRRKRRRGGRGRDRDRDRDRDRAETDDSADAGEDAGIAASGEDAGKAEDGEEAPRKSQRRRGRRGGRRVQRRRQARDELAASGGESEDGATGEAPNDESTAPDTSADTTEDTLVAATADGDSEAVADTDAGEAISADAEDAKPKRRSRRTKAKAKSKAEEAKPDEDTEAKADKPAKRGRRKKAADAEPAADDAAATDAVAADDGESGNGKAKPKRTRKRCKPAKQAGNGDDAGVDAGPDTGAGGETPSAVEVVEEPVPVVESEPAVSEPAEEPRTGWWRRREG